MRTERENEKARREEGVKISLMVSFPAFGSEGMRFTEVFYSISSHTITIINVHLEYKHNNHNNFFQLPLG